MNKEEVKKIEFRAAEIFAIVLLVAVVAWLVIKR